MHSAVKSSRRRLALASVGLALLLAGCGSNGADGGMMGGSGGGMMDGSGNGMMNGMGDMGGPVRSLSPQAVRALSRRAAVQVLVDRKADALAYRGNEVELVVLASPEGGPDMRWNIDGLVNPIVVIPRGAHVVVDFFNADTDHPHGWELTSTAPPYDYMAMMYAAVAIHGAFAMPVQRATAHRWPGRTSRFTAQHPGAYFYLCPVPGHAEKGMYGKLVIR